jgi:archaeal flagellar protein FlaI
MKDEIIDQYGPVTIRKQSNKYSYELDVDTDDFDDAISLILEDENIEEVMFNGNANPVYVYHKLYGMCATTLYFSYDQATDFIKKAADFNKAVIDGKTPILDGTLPDKSRINIVIPPASLSVSITIRKFKHNALTVLDLIKNKTLTTSIVAFLWTCIDRIGSPSNILFVGGAASGKTTLLTALSIFISNNERLVLIEDTPELQLKQHNLVKLVSDNAVSMNVLLRNALRMRPDRIIVGEVRSEEAITLFNAMNTGHKGVLGTLHANTAKETISRLTNPPMSVPVSMLSVLDLVVVSEKNKNCRIIKEIAEVAGLDSDNILFNKIFEFNPEINKCSATGIPSRLLSKLAKNSGLSIKEIDKIILKRKAQLETLIKQDSGIEDLLSIINK